MGPEPRVKSAFFLSRALSLTIRGCGHAKISGRTVTI